MPHICAVNPWPCLFAQRRPRLAPDASLGTRRVLYCILAIQYAYIYVTRIYTPSFPTLTNATSRNARVTNSSVRRRSARRTRRPPEIPRMGIKVKEVARGVVRLDPLTPRGAHQRPLLRLLLLLHPLLPQVSPRSAPKGITLPLRGIILRRGAWPGWPRPSWLQEWM